MYKELMKVFFIPMLNSNRGSILFELSRGETQRMEPAEMDERIDPLIEFARGIKRISVGGHLTRLDTSIKMENNTSLHQCGSN